MATPVMLPATIPRLAVNSQNLRRSGGRHSASCSINSLRSTQSLRLSRQPRTPLHSARTPRGKRATRWLKGRRDATLRLAHASANAATNKIASAFHVSPRQEKSKASMDENTSSEDVRREMEVARTAADRPILRCDCGFLAASVLPVSSPSGFELRVTAIDAPLTNEGLTKLFDFADTVLYSKEVPSFTAVYDLRQLRVPKMSMISEVSKWYKDPKRMATFQERCCGVTVCVQSGLKFRLAKSALSLFFKQCPISGPAQLVTSLEEGKNENVVTFGPACSSQYGKSVASKTRGPASDGTVQLADLEFTPIVRSSLLDMCGGCFDFLGAVIASGCSGSRSQREEEDAREVEELKRIVEELSARIEQLENEKRQKGGKGKLR